MLRPADAVGKPRVQISFSKGSGAQRQYYTGLLGDFEH